MKNSLVLKQNRNRHPQSIKLNRMDCELSSMMSNLHSYRCEPRTSAMHAQYIKLEGKARQLKQHIDTTHELLSKSSGFTNAIAEEINKVIKDYSKFQKRFSFYLSEVVMHS